MKHIDLSQNKELVARIMAVQACYEMEHNKKPVVALIEEFLKRGLELHQEDEDDVTQDTPLKPHGVLFKKIVQGCHRRKVDVESILQMHIVQKESEPVEPELISKEEGDEALGVITAPKEKEMEPLLKSVLTCGIYELIAHDDIDAPLIVNDYLNATHSFYEKSQVSFVNGILDAVSKAVRG